jgi:hypothetical protein
MAETSRSRRRGTSAEVPDVGPYTGGHPLEIGPKILTFSHFSARPARLFEGETRSASPVIRSRSDWSRGLSERAEHHVGRRPPKFSYRFSLIVHYLRPRFLSLMTLPCQGMSIVWTWAASCAGMRSDLPQVMPHALPAGPELCKFRFDACLTMP